MSVEDSGCDYGYILYENQSPAVVLNEEINFSKLVGYSVPNLKKSNSIQVKVSPNDKELILIKRNSNECNISLNFKSQVNYDTKDLLKSIKTKGKKHQVKAEDKEYQIFYYILDHPGGYLFFYENLEKDIEFGSTFNFTLENLKIAEDLPGSKASTRKRWKPKDENQSVSWKVNLKPGQSITKKLEIINAYDKVGFKFDYTFRILNLSVTEPKGLDIKSTVQQKGTKYDLVETDGHKIHYYVYDEIKGIYYFLFENLSKRICEIEARFELENMKLEPSELLKNTCKIVLKPNQTSLKKIVKINPKKESS